DLQRITPRRFARGIGRRLGLHRVWIPGIRPFRLVKDGREFIACHACGEAEYREFIRDPDHQVVCCATCGLYYVNPVPTPALLRERVHESAAYTDDQLLKREFFQRRAEKLLEKVEALRSPGRLLDIGCAIGTELSIARDRGWSAVGIEFAAASVKI